MGADLYHSATALIAMGDTETANRALTYLLDVQQRPDGTFPQDSWLIATKLGDKASAATYTRTADDWFHKLKGWTVTTTGKYAPEYFVKITQHGKPNAGERVTLTSKKGTWDERDIVDESFLELVRLGLMRPDDKVVLETLAVVDKVNKIDTPNGPGWRRYTHDGYGETADGVEYQGTGIGRVWPLLMGERVEYDVANGGDGRLYLDTMLNQTNKAGMVPEQVWVQAASPNPLLIFRKPNGSRTRWVGEQVSSFASRWQFRSTRSSRCLLLFRSTSRTCNKQRACYRLETVRQSSS